MGHPLKIQRGGFTPEFSRIRAEFKKEKPPVKDQNTNTTLTARNRDRYQDTYYQNIWCNLRHCAS